jgi:glycosyltransferase involved in cell wall biosynthesis
MSDGRPTKVVRIIARLNVGGPAKHVVWLTAGLPKSDYNTLLVAGTVPPGEEDMCYFAEQNGVKPLYIPEMSREVSLKDAITVWKLYRLFVRERPDIVHTHTAKAGTVGRAAGFMYRWFTPGVLVGRPRRCKFVHTYHGHIFHSYYGAAKTKFFITIEKLLARLVTNRIVVISEQQRREIADEFRVGKRNQMSVIPLGLDLELFANGSERRERFRHEHGIDQNVTLVGIVSRLTEIKNHQLFIRSVDRFKKIGSERRVKFVVIGDGSLRESLERQASELGLQQDIIFAGSRKDPEYFYPALEVVALTSRNEGTPLTLIEAMANGLPVVATCVGGVVDLLGEPVEGVSYKVCERGISVPPDDEQAFAEALARLIGDQGLQKQLGERAQAFVRRTYRKERLLEDIKNMYRELTNPDIAAIKAQPEGHRVQSKA